MTRSPPPAKMIRQLLAIALAALMAGGVKAQAAPAAVTATVFVGCAACNAAACTAAGNAFCNAASGTSVTTINVGDSVHFVSSSIVSHSVVQGGLNSVNTLSGISPICTTSLTGIYNNCGVGDPNATPVFTSGAPASTTNYTFRFDRPGTYQYYCAVHACGGMRGQIVVNPVTTPCTGSACENPLIKFTKVASGQDLTTVCGYGAPAGTGAASAATVLCWNGQSSAPTAPGVFHLYRDTSPLFNPASDPNFVELTDPNRRTCTPDFADADPLPAGAAIFFYRVCDSTSCANN